MLRPHKVVLLHDIETKFGSHIKMLPKGTPGLHLGRLTHFDLGHALQHGKGWNLTELPILRDLRLGVDLEDQGEWDGSSEGFTEQGWGVNPILSLRGRVDG